MSLVQVANLGAHLQNCTMARLPMAHVPYSRLHLQIALQLHKEGFISGIQRGSITGPDIEPEEVTFDNISSRRLWLGLKYRNSKPVLSKFQLISKPSRRVYCTAEDLRQLASGKDFRFVKPLQTGESMFVRTSKKEVFTLHEAIQKYVGGELLCRVR